MNDWLDDLVDAWHEGAGGEQSLEEYICARTDWTHEQFSAWVTYGASAIVE